MGYTHYWNRPKNLNVEKFEAWTKDIQLMLERLPKHYTGASCDYPHDKIDIRGPWGADDTQMEQPVITIDFVCFNGSEKQTYTPPSKNYENVSLAHEDFYVSRVMKPGDWQIEDAQRTARKHGKKRIPASYLFFECCKTARKPYDLLVCGALMALKYHFPNVEISSDGTAADWFIACAFYADCFEDRTFGDGPWGLKSFNLPIDEDNVGVPSDNVEDYV